MRRQSCVITVMTVLAVLCLRIFSMLSLAGARADLNLSRLNAQAVSDWYAADLEAHREYAEFCGGGEAGLFREIPAGGRRCLHLHLQRQGSQVAILSWNSVAHEEETH